MRRHALAVPYSELRAISPDDAQFEASKVLSHTDVLLSWLSGMRPAPITLELDVSLSCNDRCPRCVHSFAHSKRFLNLTRIARILGEAVELGIKGLTLSGGGEPLLHPQIADVLELVRRSGLSAGLITNGGLVRDSSLASALVKTFQWIRISLDSASEQQYRFVRGVKGFDKRLECILRLVEARRGSVPSCELGLSFLTSTSVIGDIRAAAVLARDIGVDYIQYKPKISWSTNQHHESYSLSQLGVFEAIQSALSLQTESFRVLFSGKKYMAEALNQSVEYSQFHSAWFIAAVGPSRAGNDTVPTLYLDCSAKYLPRWTIAAFDSLHDVLASDARRSLIERTSSKQFCIRPEKHTAYNTVLEALRRRHAVRPYSAVELAGMSPSSAKHNCSL